MVLIIIFFKPTEKTYADETYTAELPQATEQLFDTDDTNGLSEDDETEITMIGDMEKEQDVEEMLVADRTGQIQYIGRQPPEGYVEPRTEDLHIKNSKFQLEYRDTYQSNIVILVDELWSIDIDLFDWYKYEFKPAGAYKPILQFICYAILTYFDGNVPYDFYVNLYDEEDIHNNHPESTMIFEVQTHGKRPLNICLDMYNYKIYVEEGVKQKNPKCKQGCCN